jgi:hypothetical protein
VPSNGAAICGDRGSGHDVEPGRDMLSFLKNRFLMSSSADSAQRCHGHNDHNLRPPIIGNLPASPDAGGRHWRRTPLNCTGSGVETYPSVANRCVRARHVLDHAEDGMAKDHHAGSAGAGGETSSGHPTTSGLQPVLSRRKYLENRCGSACFPLSHVAARNGAPVETVVIVTGCVISILTARPSDRCEFRCLSCAERGNVGQRDGPTTAAEKHPAAAQT